MPETIKGRKPRTLKEAIEIIRGTLINFDLDAWAQEQPMDLALLDAHFGLGMWTRNQWIYKHPAPLASRIREGLIYCDEDSLKSHP